MINNPFKVQENLPPGFYYDGRLNCIVLYYPEKTDSPFPERSTYNRYYKKSHKDSQPEDLEEITLSRILNIDLIEDFEWIKRNKNLTKEFISFLLEEELYNIAHLFKLFSNKKEQNETNK